eukprot:15450080-Alexandrium_andersonii.AAC.1
MQVPSAAAGPSRRWWKRTLCDFVIADIQAPPRSQAGRIALTSNSHLRRKHLRQVHGITNPPKLPPRPYVRRNGLYSES